MRFIFAVLLLLSIVRPAFADPVMERVNKTQTIRCGYVTYSLGTVRDEKTGQMTGFNVDLAEEAAKRMGLKVDWAYETNWPTMSADLQAGKFDVFCVAFWSNPRSAKAMISTDPIFYQPVFFTVRGDEKRFDGDIAKLNDSAVKIGLLEGDVPETILNETYPKATRVELPQSAPYAQLFQDILAGKADATITSKPNMHEFEASNPGKLKVLPQPAHIFSSAMQLPEGAVQLQGALNIAFREMQLDGTIVKIMKKYATSPDDFYMIDLPYKKLP